MLKKNIKKKTKKKQQNMSFPRFEPATLRFKIHLQIHYATRQMRFTDKNNQYMLKL